MGEATKPHDPLGRVTACTRPVPVLMNSDWEFVLVTMPPLRKAVAMSTRFVTCPFTVTLPAVEMVYEMLKALPSEAVPAAAMVRGVASTFFQAVNAATLEGGGAAAGAATGEGLSPPPPQAESAAASSSPRDICFKRKALKDSSPEQNVLRIPRPQKESKCKRKTERKNQIPYRNDASARRWATSVFRRGSAPSSSFMGCLQSYPRWGGVRLPSRGGPRFGVPH